jgi:hypothetical protein
MKALSRVDTFLLLSLAWSVTLAVLYARMRDRYDALRRKYDELLKRGAKR